MILYVGVMFFGAEAWAEHGADEGGDPHTFEAVAKLCTKFIWTLTRAELVIDSVELVVRQAFAFVERAFKLQLRMAEATKLEEAVEEIWQRLLEIGCDDMEEIRRCREACSAAASDTVKCRWRFGRLGRECNSAGML